MSSQNPPPAQRDRDGYSPIELPSIPDVIYETLRLDIARGVYEAGPLNIRRLAERFGVSPMPVREALRRLEAESLVSFRAGRQVVVNALSFTDLEEVFDIRLELEDLAIRRATPNIAGAEETLDQLGTLIEQMDGLVDDYDAWRQTNREFHSLLYRSAAMPRLAGIINSLAVAAEPYLRLYGSTPESLRIAQQQHREILALVSAGDTEGAASLLRKHLEIAFAVVRKGSADAHAERPQTDVRT